MPQPKSVSDLRAQLDTLTKALANPTATTEEKQIYSDTIIKIQNKIGELTSTRAPEPPPGQQPPIPIRVIKAGLALQLPNPATISAQPGTQPRIVNQVEATTAAGSPLVRIDWGYGQIDHLTEGEARSRFTTCLRDLSESRLAAQGRLADLPQYRSFARGVAYYQALTHFWSAPPTALQLNISTKSPLKKAIFEMITDAAKQPE